MSIALLHPCYWPEVRRGSERFARDLSDGLMSLGHRPRLITSHPGRPSLTVEDGLPVIRNWRPPERRLRARLYTEYLTHLPFTYASLRRGDDDLAHALYHTDALAANRWARRTGRPTVYTAPGLVRRESVAARRTRLEVLSRATRESSVVVAISHAARDSLWRWLGVESRVIHQGVDVDAFRPGAERASVPTIFCPAAADDPRKRVGLLVESFARLRRDRPDAELVLVRPPAPVPQLDGPGVRFVASMADTRELARAYGSAWITVLPARGEGFGLVIVESLACGTPVVGAGEGAIPEIIDGPEVGRLFDPTAPDTLAAAMNEALELSAGDDNEAACRARGLHFSAERCALRYEQLYREVLARG